MDIMLNTVFNNPRLPRLGFLDRFERGAANTLGSTNDGKPWTIIDPPAAAGTITWGINGSQQAGVLAHTETRTNHQLAVVDTRLADGVLRGVVASLSLAELRTGLALRAVDDQNYICILLGSSPTAPGIRIQKRINNVASNPASNTTAINPGDEIAVVMEGPRIRVLVNGVTRLDANVPELVTATKHGFYAFPAGRAMWNSLELTPLPTN